MDKLLFFDSYRVSRGGLGASFAIRSKEDVLYKNKSCDRYGLIGGYANNICYMTLDEFKEFFNESEYQKAVDNLKNLPKVIIDFVNPPTSVSNKDIKPGDIITDSTKVRRKYIYLGKGEFTNINSNSTSKGYIYYMGDKLNLNSPSNIYVKSSKIKASSIVGSIEINKDGYNWEVEKYYKKGEFAKFSLKWT